MKKAFDVSLVLILLYMFNAPTFIASVINANFGISVFTNYPYLFLLPPAVIILGHNTMQHKLKLPYFKYFITLVIVYFLLESHMFRGNKILTYSFIYQITIIYTCFIIIVNYGIGRNKKKQIIITAFIILLISNFINYLGVLGVINVAESIGKGIAQSRVFTQFAQPNGQSMNSVLGIFLLYIGSIQKIFSFRRYLFLGIIIFFMGTIFLNASQGAFIILTIGTILHFTYATENTRKSFYWKIPFFIVLIFFIVILNSKLKDSFYIFKRLSQDQTKSSRAGQIKISWRRFKEHPLWGVGYYYGTKTDYGYTRSNFLYTQVLASMGIFYFIIFLWFITKMYGMKIKNHTIRLSMITGFMSIMFYNLPILFFMSIFAYLTYIEKKEIDCSNNFLTN